MPSFRAPLMFPPRLYLDLFLPFLALDIVPLQETSCLSLIKPLI